MFLVSIGNGVKRGREMRRFSVATRGRAWQARRIWGPVSPEREAKPQNTRTQTHTEMQRHKTDKTMNSSLLVLPFLCLVLCLIYVEMMDGGIPGARR